MKRPHPPDRPFLAGVVAALLTLVFVLGVPASAALATPQAEVEPWLDTVSASGVPSLAVVITRGDRTEVAAGAGRVGGHAVDEHTEFRLESLSKSFTATAVLQLVDQGRVELDVPVVKYVPDLRLDDPRARQVTVRHLLNQSSGLTDATLGFDQYGVGPRSPRDALPLLARSHFGFDPGTSWAYSNPNYWICALLVEEVTGLDLETYVQREILDRLGMDETSGAATGAHVEGAVGHSAVYGTPVPVSPPDALVAGAGGMTSTAHDMGIWLRFQQGALPGGEDVLSTAMREELHRRQAPEEGLYALGWYSGPPADGGVERTSHSGVGAGTSAYQGLFPEGVGVAVLQASSSPEAYAVAAALYDHSMSGELASAPLMSGPGRDVIATLIAFTIVALSARGIARGRRWASRTRAPRATVTLGLQALFSAAGFALPVWGSAVLGRAATWPVLFAGAPVPVVAVLAVALSVGLLTLARTAFVVAARRPARKAHTDRDGPG